MQILDAAFSSCLQVPTTPAVSQGIQQLGQPQAEATQSYRFGL